MTLTHAREEFPPMDTSGASPVIRLDGVDAEMDEAFRRARDTFRYFCREMSWERRRIIPGLDVAAIKAAFWDGVWDEPPGDSEPVEHLWMSNVEFDGRTLRAEVLNVPNQLRSVSQGSRVALPFERLEDWMYVVDGRVCGAFSVQLMRRRMGSRERREHDRAWGLDFGDPKTHLIVPGPRKRSWLSRLRKRDVAQADWSADPDAEHPMSLNAASSLREQLQTQPEKLIGYRDEQGWSLLHHEAFAGNVSIVEVLLEHGADPSATTADGRTARELAQFFGWEAVLARLPA